MRQQFIFATAQIGRIFAKIESSGANVFLSIMLGIEFCTLRIIVLEALSFVSVNKCAS